VQTRPPSILRVGIALAFALSCFGLLMFLWVAFGGPVPLSATGYRLTADFPEATTLAKEADVRVSGVNVGRVSQLELAPEGNATRVEIEIEPKFAPISEDARAILRQKSLLGETYVELSPGSQLDDGESAPVSLGAQGGATDAQLDVVEEVPEGGHLASTQVEDATQIDEVFDALDEETRARFQRWQEGAAVAIRDRALDVNDALGNLGPFIDRGADVVEILRRQRTSLRGVVRDTGAVFDALTERDRELAGVITGSNATFGALAEQERALAESFQVLPTFQRELRATLTRLDRFQADTHPLVRDLTPPARDISPTLRSVRRLSPSLTGFFRGLDVLIGASGDGFPALRRTIDGLRPVLAALDPSLANVNPIVRYLKDQRYTVTDFLAGPPAALAGSLPTSNPEFAPGADPPAPMHMLRELSYLNAQNISVYQQRVPENRGNGYLQPGALNSPLAASAGIFPNFDCRPSGGERLEDDGGSPPVDPKFAPCVVAPDFPPVFGGGQAPQLFADR
jgi:phospholipid/cholesterol/gamma-HCH transport system substrate-binding protein